MSTSLEYSLAGGLSPQEGGAAMAQNANKCVLFADVSGSTPLQVKLDDREAQHTIERCLNRMSRVVNAYHGQVVNAAGNEIMAVFVNPERAMQAAYEMQERVDNLPPASGIKLGLRIGCHVGAAEEKNGALVGEGAAIAVRIAGFAKAGQILASAELVEPLSSTVRRGARAVGELELPERAEPVRVYQLVWRANDERTINLNSLAAPHGATVLRLRHGGREFVLNHQSNLLSMGREAGNDILIRDRRASRQHARIERRVDQFVVVDQSTNGTYVLVDGGEEFILRGGESILRGRGRISFGHNDLNDGNEIVEFEVMN